MVIEKDELLFDADVLIDFVSVDIGIIKEISEKLGTAHLTTEVLREVKALNAKRCAILKLHIEVPTAKEIEAALDIEEPISFADKVTLIMAQKRGWICITNDRQLRKCCLMHNVTTRRGLSLLVDVVKVSGMKKSDAIVLLIRSAG